MTPQDYNTLATALQERGYKKHNFCPADWLFYLGKVFHEEQEIRYEVIFAVQDYGINYYMEEHDAFGVFPVSWSHATATSASTSILTSPLATTVV